jgi:hypothetical protein
VVKLDRRLVGEPGLLQAEGLTTGASADLQAGQFTQGSSSARICPIVPAGTDNPRVPRRFWGLGVRLVPA